MMVDESMTAPGGTADEYVAPARANSRLRRAMSSRIPAIGLALLTLLASGALALLAHNVSHRQEQKLLVERTNEVSSLISTTVNDLKTVLRGAGAAAVADGQSDLYTTLTLPSTLNGGAVVTAREHGASFTIVARTGTGAGDVGGTVIPEQAEVARRALAAKDLVSDFYKSGSQRHFLLALTAPNDAHTVTVLDYSLPGPSATPTDPNSPYRELDVAIYGSTVRDPDKLILLSGSAPDVGGKTYTHTFAVGADTYLIAVAPREPLVGSLATAFPWVVLGTGGALAIALGFLMETLIRRRAYALRLVDERTRSLVEARTAAEKANKAKSEFLSRMSHELRTPLNAVLGFGQLLEMDGLTPEQAENVGQITKGGAHLLDLINEILDISQIETGHMSMSPEAVLVGDVVEAAVSLLRPLADERGVHLIGGTDHGCGHFIFADRQRLKQILLNLIGNGIKYNRQGGSVSISCFEPVAGTLRIQVTDTGPGIAPDQFHLLFQPFERLGAEQTSVPGTGVGLALSRGLAEVMGGTLDVESTPGRGSTFWVEFPIVESPVKLYEENNHRTLRIEETGGHTVLHIEDNLANVELVERVLAQRPQITVVPAMQGRMGIDLARRHHPILILLDLNLLDIPGSEVLKILRDDPTTADIPVAIVSADAMPRQVQRLLSSGAIDYLTKPIDIHRLLELVDDAVAQAAGGPELVADITGLANGDADV